MSSPPLLAELARDLAEALSPLVLARRVGLTLDPWQERLVATTRPQTIALCARQSGKSTSTALKVIHVALTEPDTLCLILSPTDRQSVVMFRKIKGLYRQLGRPVAAEKENAHELELANGSLIVALPGKGDTIRGYSAARLLVLDEASRIPDSLYDAVRPMLAVSGGELIELSSPAGQRGFFYRDWIASEDDPAWERIGPIQADQNPRIDPDFLERERKALPDPIYRQEYACAFLDEVGAVFSLDQISRALADATVAPLFAPIAPTGPLADPSVTPLGIAF